MQLAFCLFNYFPYGGLQRDFLQFHKQARMKGHQVRIYCIKWDGPKPKGIDIHFVPAKALTNYRRNTIYAKYVLEHLDNSPVDLIVGFNKMPGLDIYYAADSCYEFKAREERGYLYRQTARYKHFSKFEAEVFATGKGAHILLISESEKEKFVRYYDTEPERMTMLPPGIPKDRRAPENALEIRQEFRKQFGLKTDENLLLFIGSGFVTKGLDRAILALASLPKGLRDKTRLFVLGQDKAKRFVGLAEKRSVSQQVHFLGGRDDVPRFLLGADCLIHPALNEAAGIVLLESLAAGLPVLVTDVCGYAHHIAKADAGVVVASPFRQQELNSALSNMLDKHRLLQWQENALAYADSEDLYSMHETGVCVMEEVYAQRTDAGSGK